MIGLIAALSLLPQQTAEQGRILREVGPSVVALRSRMATGTGFVVDAKGYILTNAHVATAPLPFEIEAQVVKDGILRKVRFKKALLVGVHPDRDLALVKIDPAEHGATLKPLRFSGKPPATEAVVYAIGFPHGGAAKVLTEGKITSTDRVAYRRSYLEMDAVIHPGNSGGPLCREDGSVVGVVTLKDYDADTGLAIPAWEFQPQRFVPLRQRAPDPAAATELTNEADRFLRVAQEKRNLDALACAVQLYEEACSWDPGNGELLIKMGTFQGLAGDPGVAIAYFVRGLQLNPWPEKGTDVYLALAALLGRMNRPDDATSVCMEGFKKYPDRSRKLFDVLAASSFDRKQWAEAARWSNMAIKHRSEHPQDMNRILQESRRKMTPAETGKFLEDDATFDQGMAALRREAAAAEKEGTAALTPEFKKFLETFDGVQQEGGAPLRLGGGGSVAADADAYTDDEVTKLFLDAQLAVGRDQVRSGLFDKAKETFQDIIKSSPKSPQAKEARSLLDILKDSGK